MTDTKPDVNTNPNSSSPVDLVPDRHTTVDPRNLITGNERLESEGDGKKPISFSDIDSALFADSTDGDEPNPKKDSGKKPEAEEADDEFDDLEEDLEDSDTDEDDDSELDDTEEELDEEEKEEADKEGEETEAAEKEAKETDEYDSKIIKVKVNGKWRKYTGAQMKKFVESGAHLEDQRVAFREEQKNFKADFDANVAKLKEADRILAPIYKAANEGNVQEAVLETFKLKGVNKVDAKWKLIDQMIPTVANILGIDQQALQTRIQERMPVIRQMQMKDENEFYKEMQTAPQAKNEDVEAEQEVVRFMDEQDISRPQLRNAVKWLKENTYKGRDNEITFEVIGKYIAASRAIEKAFIAINAVRPSLVGDEKFVDRVVNLSKRKPDWSADKIARWVEKQAREVAKTQKSKEVDGLSRDISRKVLKANNKSALKKSSPSSQRKPKTFSDLNPESGNFLDLDN